jgi:hypothetical protein
MIFGSIFKSNKDMKKTKVFAHEGKIGIIPGDLNISMDMENDELISIENLEITKEAFDILSEEDSHNETLVIAGYFAIPGLRARVFNDGTKISEVSKSVLEEKIVKEIEFDEEDKITLEELTEEMSK